MIFFHLSLTVNIAVVANGAKKKIMVDFNSIVRELIIGALHCGMQYSTAARKLSFSQYAETVLFFCSSRMWPQTLNSARSWITSMWCTWRIKRTATCCVTCRVTTTAPSAGRSAHTCRCGPHRTPSKSQTTQFSEGAVNENQFSYITRVFVFFVISHSSPVVLGGGDSSTPNWLPAVWRRDRSGKHYLHFLLRRCGGWGGGGGACGGSRPGYLRARRRWRHCRTV